MRESVGFHGGEHRLEGDLYLPDGLTPGDRRPGIVLLNGYTATRELYLPETARALNDAGYVALAFDFTGWGGSEGPRHRLAPHGRVGDAQAALTFLARSGRVAEGGLGVLGWSYGGATAVWLAAIDSRVACVVSIGGVGNGGRWMRSVREPAEWAALMARAAADREARLGGGDPELVARPEILKLDPESARLSAQTRKASKAPADTIPLSFVDETIAFNPEWVVERIAPRAALFVTAERDLIVPAAESQALHARAGAPKRLAVIAGSGHYDLYAGAPFAQVMGEALAWFGAHLGAGADDLRPCS